jgi:NAD-dependent dihydropyrimidine dehydrogenase PreA subunit
MVYKKVFDGYHAKVLTFNDVRKIVKLNRDVILTDTESKRVVPYPAANRIIFEEPAYIAVMDCPCRLSRKTHCQPINVCMAIGRTTAEFWLDHCARYHVRKIDQVEALEILKNSHEAGWVITAWLKTETGGRTGVICSCCSCCCGGLEGMRLVSQLPGGVKVTNILPSGYSVIIDSTRCTACGTCARVCAFSAIKLDPNNKPVYYVDACQGCGVCTDKCKQSARQLVKDPSKGVPLDVDPG